MKAVGLGFVALVLIVGAACGDDSGHSSDPIEGAQQQLSKLESATVDLRLMATASDPSGVGFELSGPFAPAKEDGALPVARLESTRVLGDQRIQATFISTGTRAFVQSADGNVVELQGRQLEGLRATTDEDADAFGGLHLDRWFATKRIVTTGDETKITGTVNAPAAINDVFGLAGAFGSGTERRTLKGDDAKRVQALVRESTIELVTNAADNMLRSLRFSVVFAPDAESEVRQLLPDLSATGLQFELELTDVGKPVRVTAP